MANNDTHVHDDATAKLLAANKELLAAAREALTLIRSHYFDGYTLAHTSGGLADKLAKAIELGESAAVTTAIEVKVKPECCNVVSPLVMAKNLEFHCVRDKGHEGYHTFELKGKE